jgi:competence protein ComEA
LIQVYVVGAIQHPGVYTLPMGARVYQLVQAAGGTLPGADLVALNLAAQLTDGEEIYVLREGETPHSGYTNGSFVPGGTGTPTAASGQLVNINTASETEMRQVLHVSAATAQKIIAYRTQHGPYTSVDQLLQVVSKSIYDHIKTLVTV